VQEHGDPALPFFWSYLHACQQKILADIGCGSGWEAAAYEQIGLFKVWGIDESEEMLKKARLRVQRPEHFLHGYFDHIPLGSGSVHVVTCLYSLHYLVNMDVGYRELHRILQPGGLLLMANRHPVSDAQEVDRFEKDGRTYIRPLIWGKIPIECPLHAHMLDYLSPTFDQLFTLIDYCVWERPNAARKFSPFLFGVAALRR
jgi:ubiquinone/menaquinone biosynthesis C-methylase UbiE